MQSHTSILAFSTPFKRINGGIYFLYGDQVYLSVGGLISANNRVAPVAALKFTPVNEMPKVILSENCSVDAEIINIYAYTLTYAESGESVGVAVFNPEEHRLAPMITYDDVERLVRADDGELVLIGKISSVDMWMHVDKTFNVSTFKHNKTTHPTAPSPPTNRRMAAIHFAAYSLLKRVDDTFDYEHIKPFIDELHKCTDDELMGNDVTAKTPHSIITIHSLADRFFTAPRLAIFKMLEGSPEIDAMRATLLAQGAAPSILGHYVAFSEADKKQMAVEYFKTVAIEALYINHENLVKSYTLELEEVFYGTTEFYPSKQWLIKAIDLNRNVYSTFSVNNFLSWKVIPHPHLKS